MQAQVRFQYNDSAAAYAVYGMYVYNSLSCDDAGIPARQQTRMHASLVDEIKAKNKENPVMVYSKSYCPFCMSVKGLFSDLEVDAKFVELDQIGVHLLCSNTTAHPYLPRVCGDSAAGHMYHYD